MHTHCFQMRVTCLLHLLCPCAAATVFDGCKEADEESQVLWVDKASPSIPFVPIGADTREIAVRCCKGSSANLQCTSTGDVDPKAEQGGEAKCFPMGVGIEKAAQFCSGLRKQGGGWQLEAGRVTLVEQHGSVGSFAHRCVHAFTACSCTCIHA